MTDRLKRAPLEDVDQAATGKVVAQAPTRAHKRGSLDDRLSLDAEERAKLQARLRRIEGQVRGLQRMVEEGRYCGDVLAQMAAVQSSLRGAGEVLLQRHLRHCMTGAIRAGDVARAEEIYDELTGLFRRYSR